MDMFACNMPLMDVPSNLECIRVDIDHIFQDISFRCRANEKKTTDEFLRLLRQDLLAQKIRNDLTHCENPLLHEIECFFEQMLQPYANEEEEDARQNDLALMCGDIEDESVYVHEL